MTKLLGKCRIYVGDKEVFDGMIKQYDEDVSKFANTPESMIDGVLTGDVVKNVEPSSVPAKQVRTGMSVVVMSALAEAASACSHIMQDFGNSVLGFSRSTKSLQPWQKDKWGSRQCRNFRGIGRTRKSGSKRK